MRQGSGNLSFLNKSSSSNNTAIYKDLNSETCKMRLHTSDIKSHDNFTHNGKYLVIYSLLKKYGLLYDLKYNSIIKDYYTKRPLSSSLEGTCIILQRSMWQKAAFKCGASRK